MANPPNVLTFDGNENDLDEKIMSHQGIVVVDFSIASGMPCIAIDRLIAKLAQQYNNHLFLHVDVERNSQLKIVYAISSLPHLKFFKSTGDENFKEVARVIGANFDEIKMTLFRLR